MAKLENSIDYIFVNEGGYVVDSGGPTNFGVTIPALASYRGVSAKSLSAKNIKDLTKIEATEVYRKEYWNKLNLDGITHQNVATAIFDIGVNRGIGIGAKYAQKAATSVDHPLNIDGVIGPKSLAAINSCDPKQFIRILEHLDWAGYQAILAKNPQKYEIYRKGWQSRAEKLLTLV